MICQDDDQCAYRPQGVQCSNRTHGRPVKSVMKIFEGHGKATLLFENCNDHGFIKISLNNKTITSHKTYGFAEFVYSKCDVLEIKEEEGANIKISSMILRRRKYFLSLKAKIMIEMFRFLLILSCLI